MAEQVSSQHLLIVEGKDEVLFFEALLRKFPLSIDVKGMGGKKNLANNLKALNDENIKAIGIVRDADDNLKGEFDSVCSALKSAALPVPRRVLVFTDTIPRIGVYIMPPESMGTNRMLEDLCLEVVKDDPTLKCVDDYFNCLVEQGVQLRPNVMAKARLHAFLASRPEPDKRLGEAAQAGYWDWNHPVFDTIKTFLQELATVS